MSDLLRPTVNQVVHNYAQKMGIQKPQLRVSAGSKNGDSYSGEVYRIIITPDESEVDDNSKNNNNGYIAPRELRLIAKLPPENKIRRQMYNSAKHFGREQYVFEKIFPAFEDFQLTHLKSKNDINGDIFQNYPETILTSSEFENEFILQNDLCLQGYVNMDRSVPLEFDKCVWVLVNLAKLHAISFAFKELNPTVFNQLVEPLTEILFVKPIDKQFNQFLKHNLDYAVTTLDPIQDKEVTDKLLNFGKEYGEYMAECCCARQDSVVLHGDCWISNILFKENVENTELKFLDWQVSRYGTVAIDLSYFIFCCTDRLLRASYHTLLEVYHTALVSRINELGCDGQQIFPYEKLEWHMNKYSKFGLGMAIMTLHATCCNPQDLVDVQTALNETDFANLQDFAEPMIKNPVYRERMADVCRDFVRLGFL